MRSTYRALYGIGLMPWNSPRVPPALAAAMAAMPSGIAVDLGCGTGAAARHLAARGWSVTAFDFIPAAIRRARQADPDGRVTWRVADVTDVAEVDPDGRLAGRADLLLDNGCLHGIPPAGRTGWAATVDRLGHGGSRLLVRAAPAGRRPVGPAGIDRPDLFALLGGWSPVDVSPDGWYEFRRTARAR